MVRLLRAPFGFDAAQAPQLGGNGDEVLRRANEAEGSNPAGDHLEASREIGEPLFHANLPLPAAKGSANLGDQSRER